MQKKSLPGRAYSIASSAAATDISQPSRKDWVKIRVVLYLYIFYPIGAPGRAYSIASSEAVTDISQPSRKDWAKIRVALKEENKQDTGAVHKTRTRDIS